MISVIIPTYREPHVLDICLKSAIRGQRWNNQIIVVVDGYFEENKEVLTKYKGSIEILDLKQNQGLIKATNLGVYNSKHDKILIVNDDNVFPYGWDESLLEQYRKLSINGNKICLTPNQVEPNPSIFKQFNIMDLGKPNKDFDINKFWSHDHIISSPNADLTGSTLPIFMHKEDYLSVGGWDESYPGPWVVDWEFFMKLELNGFKMYRTYRCHFYHFTSVAMNINKRAHIETACRVYFKYKWGNWPKNNPITNSKLI